MRIVYALLFFSLITVFSAFPASINGSVTDALTGKPMEAASVFIAGTTSGTTVRSDGSFTLNFADNGSAQLVITYLGYETYTKTVSEIPLNQSLKVELAIKAQNLSAVSVLGKDSNRKANLAEFTLGFLGESEFGKKCSILNPHVIRLVRKPIPGKIGQTELVAYADSDLIIENKLLGYTIRYTLESYVQSNYQITFKGYPLFLDNLPTIKKKEKVLDYRERAYQGSQMHFFRSLYTKTLKEEGFQLFKVAKRPNAGVSSNAYGLMADTVFVPDTDQHLVQTNAPLDLYESLFVLQKSAALIFSEPFEICYTVNGEDKAYTNNWVYYSGMSRSMGQQTTIALLNDNPMVFYPNGSNKNAGNVITIGYWSFKKVGEILPWDYQPPESSKHVVTLH